MFANSGMTGQQHMDHARPLILRWMSLRARFGFSEWLSNVYWMEDLKGLLLLADWSDDPEITHWASALLDVQFVELASHLQNGSFGATHGRSYLKDKMTARDEDTYSMAKMVFDDTPTDYEGVDNAVAARNSSSVPAAGGRPRGSRRAHKSASCASARASRSTRSRPIVARPGPALRIALRRSRWSGGAWAPSSHGKSCP